MVRDTEHPTEEVSGPERKDTPHPLKMGDEKRQKLFAHFKTVKPVEFEEMVNLIQRFEAYWAEINRTPTSPSAARQARPEPTLS